jgi:hypothetical protein
MHIEAELDDIHAAKLFALQQRLNKSLSEVITDLIDANWSHAVLSSAENEPSPLFQAFESAGLIGCIATDEELSTTYKQKLDFSDKTAEASE